ncbi:hypothetical protein B9479_007329 [Cryptococcus floricola]|uniref:Elongator complex protein 5 n=1 Tax=Cryptococcus floricola TaxID=2591691 RepID=A0A5D3AMS0_9TREE|nr:hypothetical protein B9479_007329 [Cryptococcus floricola]
MTFLTPHLPFPNNAPLPPPASHLIISDTVNSPAYFALYHLLAAALGGKEERERRGRKVVWVDLRGEGRGSLESVMKKIGTPLPPTTSPKFIHLAPSSLPHTIPVPPGTPRLFDKAGRPSLRGVYDKVGAYLRGGEGEGEGGGGGGKGVGEGVVVILDGLGGLVDMGMGVDEVVRFVRAVYSQVRKVRLPPSPSSPHCILLKLKLTPAKKSGSILTTTLHTDSLPLPSPSPAPYTPGADVRLLEGLMRVGAGCWWRVSHLGSGRSGDVGGEISVHPFGDLRGQGGEGEWMEVGRGKPVQYRLETGSVRVFAKGTGRGFL